MIVNIILFLPETIDNDVKRPNHAFLEKVRNVAKPTEKSNPKVKIFLKKEFPFSINEAMQIGQINFSHVPA